MCLGIPGKIVDMSGMIATVDVAGTRRDASLMLLDGAGIGDYVIVHAGFAIQKVNEVEAAETLRLVDELVRGAQP